MAEFKGTANLDIRNSKPDWPAFLDKKAAKDAPNVLVILYDDTGCAAWSPYGGRINMPTMDRLAKNGLTYSQRHTTSVCSPTRSCFLTGRNHHQNGLGTIAESAAVRSNDRGVNNLVANDCFTLDAEVARSPLHLRTSEPAHSDLSSDRELGKPVYSCV